MKNLRKVLVLVLVVAMVFSIGAIGASAAFVDTTSSNYKEAIDVMSGIGVINGTSATASTFEPTGSLTRESAAKIITYMLLGPTNAALISSATTQKFSDVPTTRWSAGYVEYCANLGIIVGSGDGTFNPTGTLTTAAFTKMLLVAVGYNANVEGYVGSNWAINVASDALTSGIYDTGIAISATATCTREQAAQLAFKALTAKTVMYVGGSTITVGDTTITTGATMGYVAGSEAAGANYNGDDGDGYMQFVEQHFSLLKLAPATNDVFGRPAHKWTNNVTVIGLYADTPVVTYNGAKLASTVAADLNGYKLDGVLVNNSKAYEVAKDGTDLVCANGVTGDLAVDIGEKNAAIIAGETGNGKLVEVYAGLDKEITAIVEVNYSVGSISAVTTTSTGTTYAILGGDAAGNYTNYTNDKLYDDTISTSATLAKGDVVTYVKIGTVAYVYATTKVVGNQTSSSSIGKITVAGTTYTVGSGVSDGTDNVALADFANSPVSANYYIDQFGFVVATTASAKSTNYVYVVGTYGTVTKDVNGTVPSAQVKVVKADGTVATYTVKLVKAVDADTSVVTYTVKGTDLVIYSSDTSDADSVDDAVAGLFGGVYGYTLSDTTISLEALTANTDVGNMVAGNVYYDAVVDGITNGKTFVTADGETVLFNASSVYVVYNSTLGTATVYTGNAGLPVTATVDGAVVVLTASGNAIGTASYAFATVTDGFSSATTANYVYVDKDVFSTSLNALGTTVYTYTGYKADGTTISLTSTGDDLNVSGLYLYNSDNSVTDDSIVTYANEFIDLADLTVTGTLLFDGTNYYNITGDTKTVYVNPALSTVDGNAGYVVLSKVAGHVTTNVATIYVTAASAT